MLEEEKITKEKFVETINGEQLPISKCRKYDSGFYKIGDRSVENSGDCYLLEDKRYYRYDTGQVVFNHTTKEYTLKNSSLILGIIDSDLNEGFFSINNDIVEIVKQKGERSFALNCDIFENNYSFRERLEDGVFYHIDTLKAEKFNIKRIPKNEYKTSLPYDSKTVMKKYVEIYKNYKPSIKILQSKEMCKILNGLTFGVEFETTKGFIPESKLNKLGLIPLRDGSITGIEYVTVPLEGEKGICNLIESINELKYRTEFDDRCALHIHLGNVPRDEAYILAFLKMTLGVQDELFSMFNLYKKYNFGYKNKNYSAPYNMFHFLNKMDSCIEQKDVRRNFDILFSHLTEGNTLATYTGSSSRGLEHVNHHHRDPTGNQKWNIRERYHFHNLIQLIFGNKTTIEFRIHTPTYDKDKIIWFLLFNAILVNYVKENVTNILNGKINSFHLENIIINYLESKRINNIFISNMIKYLRNRKKVVENFNRLSDIHFSEDKIKSNIYFPVSKINEKEEFIEEIEKSLYPEKDINYDYSQEYDIKYQSLSGQLLEKINQMKREPSTMFYTPNDYSHVSQKLTPLNDSITEPKPLYYKSTRSKPEVLKKEKLNEREKTGEETTEVRSKDPDQ